MEKYLMAQQFQQFKIQINGIETKVLGEIIDKTFWCYVNQEIYSFELADLALDSAVVKRKKSAVKAMHLIVAPMPGKITKVFVQKGDAVKKSQPLLVMEAMKMEYTLKSDLSTIVEKMNIQVGDQVTLGHLLIELKSEESI